MDLAPKFCNCWILPNDRRDRSRNYERPTARNTRPVLTRLDRISQRASSHRDSVFNNLFSLFTEELLWEAWFGLKGGKAPGIDGVTLEDYGENLLMAFRNKVRLMAKRHLSRRSQKSYVNWDDFNRFTELHPLANPKRLKDLIAMNREWLGGRDK